MKQENNMQKMWTILLHLGSNMWAKPDAWDALGYHETMYCNKDTWTQITNFLPQCGINTVLIDMGEGVQLDKHPEIAIPGSWTKKEFREELARLRDMGLTPLPKFNFSCAHNAWMQDYGNMVGTARYNQFCRDVIEDTIEMFDGPAFFHLGLEEECAEDQASNRVSIVRSPEKMQEDAADLFETCRKNGARPWIWMDPALVRTFGGEEHFCDNVPKDVLMSNWYYGFVSKDYKDSEAMYGHSHRIRVYNLLDEWGYEQIPTGSTYLDRINNEQLMYYCKDTFKHPENIRGFMTASWLMTTPDSRYGLEYDAWMFGRGKAKVYPEECE